MINRQQLLSDLQKLLQRLEADLLERSMSAEVPEVGVRLKEEHERATKAQRTAQNYEDWRTDAITQAAAAWVLSCVFVRFLEDNRLIEPPRISGPTGSEPRPSGSGSASAANKTPLPDGRGSQVDRLGRARDEHELYFRQHPKETDREYLLSIFDQLAKLPGTKDVFGEHNPIRELPNWLSGDAAGELLKFFQKIDANTGALVHDFTSGAEPRPSGSVAAGPLPDGRGSTFLDTRFLGDLYQDLSEAARKKYALLQTPEFVEEFILDRTLDPALDEFGLEPIEPRPSGSGDAASLPNGRGSTNIFKMIDPACGSGHFLLGSFPRILDRWMKKEPGTNVRELVQRTLDSIHGVDVNPFAIAIARFRLLLAALNACSIQRLADAPAFQLNLVCGDSLLHAPLASGGKKYTAGQQELDFALVDDVEPRPSGSGETQPLPDGRGSRDADECDHAYRSENLPELKRLLRGGQYHAVVANPPYITPKDRQLNDRYRRRFLSCHMKYSLSVPFLERIFRLAIPGSEPRPSGSGEPKPLPDGRGSAAGYTGQITANSFMKREFGKKLIEKFFPVVDLTHVIDTSGAYIPGHGTPTVILFGRHRVPVASTLRTVMGIRGEPSTPADPARGLVWSAIVETVDSPQPAGPAAIRAATVRERNVSGSQGEATASLRARLQKHAEFVSVADSSRELFHKHPWSIGGGGASELKELLEERAAAKLESLADSIGITSFTLEDDVFILPEDAACRWEMVGSQVRPMVVGDVVRDWMRGECDVAVFPYDHDFTPIEEPRPSGSGLASLLPDGRGSKIDARLRYLWIARTCLANNKMFGGKTKVECGMKWYEFGRLSADKLRTPLSIVFAFVATHNHFVLDRGGKVFKQTAPVIKLPAMIPEPAADHEPRPSGSGISGKTRKTPLPDGRGSRPVTEDDHLALVGLLNSSTACFWMKQVCHNKGSTVDQHGARQRTAPFEDFFAFNGTKLQQFPLSLPDGRGSKANEKEPRPSGSGVLGLARRIDKLAQQRQLSSPTSVLRVRVPSRDSLSASRAASDETLRQMMAAQEELDWECYRLYGLITDDLTCYPTNSSRDRQGAVDSPKTKEQEDRFLTGAALGIKLGQRAFEIVLARKMAAGEAQTTWFERHGSTPITELPAEWPDDYRQLVERRIALIESDPNIRLIEQPEYKRRWNTEPWESQLERALREWLLNRLEGYFDFDGRMREGEASAEPATSSRARQEAVSDADMDATPTLLDDDWNGARLAVPKAEVEPQAYFVTFTCYGTWLHGDERGSVDREHNEWQAPPLDADEERERREFELLRHSPVKLEAKQRLIVHRTIQEVCQNRGWRLHAVNVRTNHIHVVVTANRRGKRVLNDFKSYATRRMKEAESLPAACLEVLDPASSRARQEAEDSAPKFKVWTRGGSARPILTENSFRRAIEYTLYEQGSEITPGISGESRARATGEELRSSDHGKGATDLGNAPLPDGRGSSPPFADIALVSVARLASVAGQDADFLQVGELYRDDAAFDVQALVTELMAPECVPLLPVLRYKPAGLIKRTTWERTWDLQRQEDRMSLVTGHSSLAKDKGQMTNDAQRMTIPVPTKYDSKDFLTSDFWRLRGKLDVPKERWISFPHCDGPDGTMMLCWAGYDHLQQARAISAYYVQVQTEFGGSDDPRLIPLLACLIELLPWLKQWHNDLDPEFNMSMGDYFEGFINEEARQLGKTIQEIKDWVPPKKTGRQKKKGASK